MSQLRERKRTMNTFYFTTTKSFDETIVHLVVDGEVLAIRAERGNRASENRMEWAASFFENIADWECVEAPAQPNTCTMETSA